MEEERKPTPEETLFKAKAELEQKLISMLKDFAGTFATSVVFKGEVNVQSVFTNAGQLVESRVSRVEMETKISQ